MSPQPLQSKSFEFALLVVSVYKNLVFKQKEFVISKQLLRSGTSIGANVAEAQKAGSKRDFIAKLQISLKESSETLYWLNLLKQSGYTIPIEAISVVNEITSLLTVIIKSAKRNASKKYFEK